MICASWYNGKISEILSSISLSSLEARWRLVFDPIQDFQQVVHIIPLLQEFAPELWSQDRMSQELLDVTPELHTPHGPKWQGWLPASTISGPPPGFATKGPATCPLPSRIAKLRDPSERNTKETGNINLLAGKLVTRLQTLKMFSLFLSQWDPTTRCCCNLFAGESMIL